MVTTHSWGQNPAYTSGYTGERTPYRCPFSLQWIINYSILCVVNIAFIDGQNLHLGVRESQWDVNHSRFRIYLREKYSVEEAYYHLGYVDESHQDLYDTLQRSGFIVKFREHNPQQVSKKKGNVDTDIVFEIMKCVIERGEKFDKILLVSGDGDYKKMVDYLIRKERFEKILFPNKRYASSLYKGLGSRYFDYLENNNVKPIIECKK